MSTPGWENPATSSGRPLRMVLREVKLLVMALCHHKRLLVPVICRVLSSGGIFTVTGGKMEREIVPGRQWEGGAGARKSRKQIGTFFSPPS